MRSILYAYTCDFTNYRIEINLQARDGFLKKARNSILRLKERRNEMALTQLSRVTEQHQIQKCANPISGIIF